MLRMRLIAAAIFVVILGYTGVVIAAHGWDLVPVFFGSIAAMDWQGQFNVDFSSFLVLSALWVAWRNDFSMTGWLLAPLALFGGGLFLSVYLFILSGQGDMKMLLLGPRRAAG